MNDAVRTPEDEARFTLESLHGIFEDLTIPGSAGYLAASQWVREDLGAMDDVEFGLVEEALGAKHEEVCDAVQHWADMQVVIEAERARRTVISR